LLKDLAEQDYSDEIRRRRALYQEFSALFHDLGIEPVFAALPEHTAPYGFPFRANEHNAAKVQRVAECRGLDVSRWPDLPDVVAAQAPEYYRSTWLLNFLW
jgi:hypothetical protein